MSAVHSVPMSRCGVCMCRSWIEVGLHPVRIVHISLEEPVIIN